VIIAGVILTVLGLILGSGTVYVIGLVLLCGGVALFALGAMGRPVGSRRHYY
jgi:hypothetical protein